MRKITYTIFWITLFVTLFWNIVEPLKQIEELKKETTPNARLAEGIRSKITYLQKGDKALTFNIQNFTKSMKFIFTPNLSEETNTSENITDIYFSISYTFYNNKGEEITSKIHHLKSAFILFEDSNHTVIERSFYLESKLKPMMSKTMLLDLSPYPDASKIKIKVEEKDPIIVDIGVRAYHLEHHTKDRLNIIWQRMPLNVRERLARGNIFDIRRMTNFEKENLVSNLWRPDGPLGVFKRDFILRRLFVLESEEFNPYNFIQAGFYAKSNLIASKILPKGDYTLTLNPIEKTPTNITIHYHINGLIDFTKNIKIEDKNNTTFKAKEEGLLEIISNKDVELKLQYTKTKEPIETLPTRASYYYFVDINNSLMYEFYTPSKRLLRVEARLKDELKAPLTIVINDKEYNYNLDFEPSYYDYFEEFEPLSKPFFIYLTLPENTKNLKISSSKMLFIRVASRSINTSYPLYSFSKIRYPELMRKLGWFTIYPKEFQNLKEQEIAIFKQPHPPKKEEALESGFYRSKQLLPNHFWQGYTFLLKRAKKDYYIRPQSWQTIFTKLNLKKREKLTFFSEKGVKEITPSLLTITDKKISPFSIYLDNEVISHQGIYTNSNLRPLIKTTTKEPHKIWFQHQNIETNTSFFINYTSKSKENTYFKRKFILFNKPLSFKIKKESFKESIGVYLLKENNNSLPLSIKAKISKIKEPKSITPFIEGITHKSYELNFDKDPTTKLFPITHNLKNIIPLEPIFIKLYENLIDKEYILTIYPPKEINKKEKLFIFVNHLILEKKPLFRMYKEVL